MAIHIVNAFSNTCFQNNQTITSVDLHNIPFVGNSMWNAFNGCSNLQTVTNINRNVTNTAYTFVSCTNLVNAPVIPNSVTNMGSTFSSCSNLINVPEIPNSVTNMYGTFMYCTNLTGNVNIQSNQITNAVNCFNSTIKNKDIYIPFKYDNGVYTQTYNSFINAGYSTAARKDGALLKDINYTPHPQLDVENYNYTADANDNIELTDYIGTDPIVIIPEIEVI